MFTALIRIVENNNTALGRLVEDFFNPYPVTMNYDILANKAKMIKNLERGSDSMEIVREYLTEEDWDKAISIGKENKTTAKNPAGYVKMYPAGLLFYVSKALMIWLCHTNAEKLTNCELMLKSLCNLLWIIVVKSISISFGVFADRFLPAVT